jgi:hypothetical protein
MSWYNKNIFAARQDSSAEAYLARNGIPPQIIQHVSTLPPDLKGKAVGFLTKNPQATIEMLMANIGQQKVQQPKAPPTPVLDARFANPQDKQQFLSQIPKEYHQWVTNLLNNQRFAFIPSEDGPRLFEALKNFSLIKTRGLPIEKDINQYKDLVQLETAVAQFSGTGSKAGGFLQHNPLSLPGVQLFKTLKDGTAVYRVSNADSLAKLGIGTKWCTREEYEPCQAQRYIQKYQNIYVFVQGGKPIMQMTPDLNQVMDVNDKDTSLPRELYGDFAQKLSEKTHVPVKLIMDFASEQKANDPKFVMKAIRQNGSAIQFASDEIKNNPQFVIEATKQNPDAFEWASDDIQNNENVLLEVNRIKGEFDFNNLSSSDIGGTLGEIFYGGARELGIEPTLTEFNYVNAYDQAMSIVDRGRGYQGMDSRIAGEAGPVLAEVAIDSDVQKLAKGYFTEDKMKAAAFKLAINAHKHPRMKYPDKLSPEYLEPMLAPYWATAEADVRARMEHYRDDTKRNPPTPEQIQKNIRSSAFQLMQAAPLLERGSVKTFEDLSPELQVRFMSEALDEEFSIGQVYEKRQRNEEENLDNYDDSYLYEGGYFPEEPVEIDFKSKKQFQIAHDQWQTEVDKIRDEQQDEWRKENLPFCLDDEIIETIEKKLPASKFKLPTWIGKFFSRQSGNRPSVLWAVESIMKKHKEQVALQRNEMRRRKRRVQRVAGWYGVAKISA